MRRRIPLLLRSLRRHREITLGELATRTGINVSALSRGERGLIELNPDQKAILAKFFGVTPHDLMRPVRTPGVEDTSHAEASR